MAVADSDLELRGVLLALPAFLPSVISSFLPKIRGVPPRTPPLDTPLHDPNCKISNNHNPIVAPLKKNKLSSLYYYLLLSRIPSDVLCIGQVCRYFLSQTSMDYEPLQGEGESSKCSGVTALPGGRNKTSIRGLLH